MTDISKQLIELSTQLQQNKVDLQESLKTTSHDIRQEILVVRNHAIGVLLKENRGLRDRIRTLESRFITLDQKVNRIEQNGRKSNFEVDGIPTNVQQEHLASKVVDIVNSIADEKITVKDVEACHRLRSKQSPPPTIVRMKRNFIDDIMKNKKKLAGLDKNLNFPDGTKIFLNPNLSPSMRSLHFNARRLKKDNKIADTWFSNAAVKIRHLDGSFLKVEHEFELYTAFPNYEFSFDTSLYDRVLNSDMEDWEYMGEYDDPRSSEPLAPPESRVAVTAL
jgi:hypothetical protein